MRHPFCNYIKEKTNNYITYIKYIAAVTVLIAITLHTIPSAYPYNVIIHLVGAMLWTVVGLAWKEGAILLNFLPQIFILAVGLVINYV